MSLGKPVVGETLLFGRASSNFRKFHNMH